MILSNLMYVSQTKQKINIKAFNLINLKNFFQI